jgi:hypothetical protein
LGVMIGKWTTTRTKKEDLLDVIDGKSKER